MIGRRDSWYSSLGTSWFTKSTLKASNTKLVTNSVWNETRLLVYSSIRAGVCRREDSINAQLTRVDVGLGEGDGLVGPGLELASGKGAGIDRELSGEVLGSGGVPVPVGRVERLISQ